MNEENKAVAIVAPEVKELLVGLTEDKATELTNVFLPRLAALRELEDRFNGIVSKDINKDTCNESKALRLIIRKIRTGADKDRKAQKAEIVRAGKAIDGLFHLVEYAVVSKEDKLKEIETHFERLEEEKIKTRKAERSLEISKYMDEDHIPQGLGTMDDNVWENYLAGIKASFEAAREAERKTEEDRIIKEKKAQLEHDRRYQTARLIDFIDDYENVVFSDLTEEEYGALVETAVDARTSHEEEQEKNRLENIRLKKAEDDRKEKERKEAEKLELKKKNNIEKYSKILLESGYESKIPGVYILGMYRVIDSQLETLTNEEFEQRLSEAKKNHERDLKLESEKNEREKLQRELKEENRLKEEKRISDEEARKAAEMAPDKEKIKALMIQFDSLRGKLSSKEAKKAVNEAYTVLDSALRKM